MKKPIETGVEYGMTLVDDHDSEQTLPLRVCTSGQDNLLLIGADGYGELSAVDGHGWPILVEFHKGQLRVMIWGDINQEEPTHIISLEGARDVRRQDGD